MAGPTKKLMANFIDNSLNNLGYIGLNFKGHHIVGRRDNGTTSWTDNGEPITAAQAQELIDGRFK